MTDFYLERGEIFAQNIATQELLKASGPNPFQTVKMARPYCHGFSDESEQY
jgi:hypothetical protein